MTNLHTLPASEETLPATDMPGRIYAVKSTNGCVVSFSTPSLDYNIEYVRADLVQATREQAVRECAEMALAMPKLRQLSPDHVAANTPQDVALAILSLSQVSAKK